MILLKMFKSKLLMVLVNIIIEAEETKTKELEVMPQMMKVKSVLLQAQLRVRHVHFTR